MARAQWLERGKVCRILNDRGVSEEIRGRLARISSIRADGFVNVSVRSGPAKGASWLLAPTELKCSTKPSRKTSALFGRIRRRRR